MALQHLINHVSLVVDKSGSMSRHATKVVDVFDRELNALKQRSVDIHQETRISIYLFDHKIEVLTFDMDVMRFTSLKNYYRIGGSTALLDATMQAVQDNRKLPELYGDHAFLTYVITDGQENASHSTNSNMLSKILNELPDNWTNAILVPDNTGVNYAQRFGFNLGSISTWDTNAVNALDNIGTQFNSVMTNYMSMRAGGVRGTKNLFTMDTSNISLKDLVSVDNKYSLFEVKDEVPIRMFVEQATGRNYKIGSTYYEPLKTVIIQKSKNILLQNLNDGKIYSGDNIRSLLGLPHDTVSVNPGNHKDWRIFVQSTSTNRKLFPNSYVLVTK